MGYLDKSTITVDAILTNRGRELLSQGTSDFNITKFAIADDEVDYGLYNTAHPLGSSYYGAIIENMPVLEATPDETQIMRYKLVTITGDDLTRFGTAVIPQIGSGNAGLTAGATVSLYYDSTSGGTAIAFAPETTYTSDSTQKESNYTLLIGDSSLVRVTTDAGTGNTEVQGTSRGTLVANGNVFRIAAKNKTGTTTATVFGAESGAVFTFTLSITAA